MIPAPTKPTLIEGVPFADYAAWRLMSQSVLKAGTKSMAHLKAAFDGPNEYEVTDAKLLGSALHVAFLEPTQLSDRVAKWEGKARRGAEWEAFKAENEGKILLTENAHDQLSGMLKSMRRHPVVSEWSRSITATEVAATGLICGELMKGRADALSNGPILFDLKKVRSADARAMATACIQYGYHIQGWMYRQIFGKERIVLVCVEDYPPYDVVPYELSPAMLGLGEQEGLGLVQAWQHCKKVNEWPGRSADLVELDPPTWAVDMNIDFGDE